MGLSPKETSGTDDDGPPAAAADGVGGKSAAGFCKYALESTLDERGGDGEESSGECSSRGGVCGRISADVAINSSIVVRI